MANEIHPGTVTVILQSVLFVSLVTKEKHLNVTDWVNTDKDLAPKATA